MTGRIWAAREEEKAASATAASYLQKDDQLGVSFVALYLMFESKGD